VNIKLLEDRVAVKAIQQEEKTKGGIVLPDTVKERPVEGTVVAVGTGRVFDNGQVAPMTVKVGDRVLYSRYGGTEVKLEGEEYLILSERDIMAVFN